MTSGVRPDGVNGWAAGAHLHSTVVLQSYSLTTIRFSAHLVEALERSALPRAWRRYPSSPDNQAIGDRWIAEKRTAVLGVPSAIIPAGSNFLINPAHPDFSCIEIDPPDRFEFDPRLVKS